MARLLPAPQPTQRYRARRATRIALLAALAAAGSAGAQETIYKSIDADGNVTYSSTPPEGTAVQRVETVEMPPQPTPAEQSETERRMRDIEQLARERSMQQQSGTRTQHQSLNAAERELQQAREELAKAKERGPGDWQTIVTGGRVPSAAYLQRVQHAQQRVQAAEEALQAARAGGR